VDISGMPLTGLDKPAVAVRCTSLVKKWKSYLLILCGEICQLRSDAAIWVLLVWGSRSFSET